MAFWAADSTNAALATAAGLNVPDTLSTLGSLSNTLNGGLSGVQEAQSNIQGTGIVVSLTTRTVSTSQPTSRLSSMRAALYQLDRPPPNPPPLSFPAVALWQVCCQAQSHSIQFLHSMHELGTLWDTGNSTVSDASYHSARQQGLPSAWLVLIMLVLTIQSQPQGGCHRGEQQCHPRGRSRRNDP